MKYVISNQDYELTFENYGINLKNRFTDKFVFRNATSVFSLYNGVSFDLLKCEHETIVNDDSINIKSFPGPLEIHLSYELKAGCSTLNCHCFLLNNAERRIALGDVSYLFFDRRNHASIHGMDTEASVYSIGYAMGASNASLNLNEPDSSVFVQKLNSDNPKYLGQNIVALKNDENENVSELTLYFDKIGEADCGVSFDRDAGIVKTRVSFRGTVLPVGSEHYLPALYVNGVLPAGKAITEAVDLIKNIYNPPLWKNVHTGWCSWYYYYHHVTEKDILENLQCMVDNRDRLPYEYVQIDDGYQLHWGDWLLPGHKFPHDMKYLSHKIHAMGFKPGIWVAPMIMTVQSTLYKEHPEWVIRDYHTGEPLMREGWSPADENPWVMLDGTNPEFLEHIKRMFTIMAHDWKYEYFKLDAIVHGAIPGIRHDPTKTGIQALRMVFEAIREAVGDKKYILGCTAPFASMVGIVNGGRVSGDVSTVFKAMKNALPQSIWRTPLHGKWWMNDPDCVLTRSQGTPHLAHLSEKGMSLDEARLFVSVIGFTQGVQMVGENMMLLEEDRIKLLEMIYPLLPAPAQQLDIFEPIPETLVLKTDNGILVNLMNWDDENKKMSLTLAAIGLKNNKTHTAFELWDNLILKHIGKSMEIEVPAHGCRVLLIKEESEKPAFLASDTHISCGSTLVSYEKWNETNKTLEIKINANRSGKLYCTKPEKYKTVMNRDITEIEDVVIVDLIKGDQAITIQFN